MKLILFGTGEYYQRYKIWFETEEVCALADNSKDKWGTYIDNRVVISPDEIIKYDYDAIFVLTFAIKDISEQLVSLGVDANCIHTFYDIHELIYEPAKRKKVEFYYPANGENVSREIVLMNSDLVMGGPALALFNMAKVLKKNGYSVTYASMVDGPLKSRLLENGIPVIVDNNLLAETMLDNGWIEQYSLVICNTINYHVFLSKRRLNIPVIWWLHDPLFFYEVANKKALGHIKKRKLLVCAVGPVARNAILQYRPDFEVHNLIYGVENNNSCIEKKEYMEGDIIRFITIGFVEPHKGQDILVEAIKGLHYDIRHKCEFIFVGKNVSMYAEQLQHEAGSIQEIRFTGVINHDEIHEYLDRSDVLICPSRQDCMPTVCAEAMMHSVPCLVADVVGTVPYIISGSGRIFKSESVEDLKQQIIWFVENKHLIEKMGLTAKGVFEQTFSMDTFEKKVMQIVAKIYK